MYLDIQIQSDNETLKSFTDQLNQYEGSMVHIHKEVNLNPNNYYLLWKR